MEFSELGKHKFCYNYLKGNIGRKHLSKEFVIKQARLSDPVHLPIIFCQSGSLSPNDWLAIAQI